MHPTDSRWIKERVAEGVLREEAERTLAQYQRLVAECVDPVTGKLRTDLPPREGPYYGDCWGG